jgi:hypothetical protein
MTKIQTPKNDELKHRILARKHELEAKLETFKADTIGKSAEVRNCIQKDLDELSGKIEHGWENLNEATTKSLNDWFKHTEMHQ